MSFFTTTWGDIAGAAGLGVSIATFVVARRAKQAAEAAKAAARRRSLAEELQEAQRKAKQIGLFLRDRRWDIVFLRAQEVVAACSLIPERWEREFSERSKRNILMAQTQVASIARAVAPAPTRGLLAGQEHAIVEAQQRAHALLSAEWGQSLGNVERS